MNMFSKVFGTHSQREVKRIMPLVNKIEGLRPEMQKLTDEELRDKTRQYKTSGRRRDTDDPLPEALQPSARQQSVYWEWNITRYSLSAVSSSIRAVSQR